MDIGAVSSSSFTPNPAAEARAARVATDKARGAETAVIQPTRGDVSKEPAPTRADVQRASQGSRTAQSSQTASGGSIEFDHDEGTRVMKVLDSKDVLIYQVPPKGELTLIRAAETEAKQAIASA